ncbi:hypothetical protein L6164_004070 [Bauhinia variegata]|uniref:Uncharacterized protein n=1 Tax=Bauhinia variegata TaxID=167791 RepID=A0ACB9Q3C2_BAUVA|nr:hypothetical protein L6164_004070 [Bauhinia variegata]
MAATLTLLKLPIFRNNINISKPHQFYSMLPRPSISATLNVPKDDSSNPPKFLDQKVNAAFKSASFSLTAFTLPFLLEHEDALAAGGELGILEGRTCALVHPIVMGSLFFFTLWTGYLGWQWRRVRTIQDEINELKKQEKSKPATSEGTTVDAPPSADVEVKIQQLTEERKELLKGSFRDRHYNAASILLGLGVLDAVGGGLNTWFRTGKLFPGPHLFAGAAITVSWALAAALVPSMQKGSETARNLHISLNTINVLLFVWQLSTGINLVFKVFEFTQWP